MKRIREIDDEMTTVIKKITSLQRKIDKLTTYGKNRIVIFGVGEHTRKLLEYIDFSAYEIRVCDTVKNGLIQDIIIEKPTKELFEWSDVIILSTFFYTESMRETVCIFGEESKILSIYNEGDEIPFFQFVVETTEHPNVKEIDIVDQNKYKTWTLKGSGLKYEQTVEKAFFRAVVKDYFLSYIKENDCICEVGAGTGRLTVEIARRAIGGKVIAVDTSEDMLNCLKSKMNIETVLVEDEKLPFEDGFFDVVVSCDAMFHFSEWRNFLKEHKRVLKQKGYIIYNICNDDHAKLVSEDKEIRRWFFSGKRTQYITISKNDLEEECQRNGLTLDRMIPYGLFVQSGFCFEYLTRGEMAQLTQAYRTLFSNEKIEPTLRRIEREVVSELPEWMTLFNICVLRKQ